MCRVGFRVTKPKSYFTKLGVRDMQKMNIPERAKYCALVSIVICLAAYAAWLLSGRPKIDEIGSDLSNLWADLRNEGPELSDNTTYYWRTGGLGGLTLDLVNLLDDSWQGEYEIAVLDWDNGDPDVLNLRSEKGDPSMPCTNTFGVMKVCNGNYGDNGWLGINEIVSSQTTIESSVAKMNDYYLAKASLEERRYTMCHELGHGFGLPHTDENFYNPDLGNCMDYTNNPGNNMFPGSYNFLRLEEMYGLPNQPLMGSSTLDQSTPSPTFNMFDPNNRPQGTSKEKKHKQNRNLRSRNAEEVSSQEKYSELPIPLAREYELAMAELQYHIRMQQKDSGQVEESGWRRLKAHFHGAEFVRPLGKDHHIKVQMLYASSPYNE